MNVGEEYAQWFESLGKCRGACGRDATGYLRNHRNGEIGKYCGRCAERAISKAHRRREFHPDATLNGAGNG
jgi:hypothetical protein